MLNKFLILLKNLNEITTIFMNYILFVKLFYFIRKRGLLRFKFFVMDLFLYILLN